MHARHRRRAGAGLQWANLPMQRTAHVSALQQIRMRSVVWPSRNLWIKIPSCRGSLKCTTMDYWLDCMQFTVRFTVHSLPLLLDVTMDTGLEIGERNWHGTSREIERSLRLIATKPHMAGQPHKNEFRSTWLVGEPNTISKIIGLQCLQFWIACKQDTESERIKTWLAAGCLVAIPKVKINLITDGFVTHYEVLHYTSSIQRI